MRHVEYRGFNDSLLSLRGIAALMVLVFHAADVFPVDGVQVDGNHMHWLSADAISVRDWVIALSSGSPWVTFFFVHSGFVLALGLSRQKKISPAATWMFYLRRASRLWPMIIFSSTATFIYFETGFVESDASIFSSWYRDLLGGSAIQMELWRNIVLAQIGLNWFFWSLQIEVLGSSWLPALVIAARRFFSIYVAVLAIGALAFFLPIERPLGLGDADTVLIKLTCILTFVGGVLLPFLYSEMKWLSRAIGSTPLICLGIAGLILPQWLISELRQVIIIGAVASALIVFNIYYTTDGPIQRFCRLSVMRFYGAISYSFYVNSLLMIHIAGRVIAETLPAETIRQHGLLATLACITLSLAINTPLSWLTYMLIERPLMTVGQRISDPAGWHRRPIWVGRKQEQ